jgi:hypothetical protein
LLFCLPFYALPLGDVARATEDDSASVANQSVRVMTFKAVPGTERLFILANSIMGLIKKTALLNIRYQ